MCLPDELPGFDLSDALYRLMGNACLLREIILEFAENHAGMVEQIKDSMTVEDWDGVRRRIHSLKGVAGNIGAQDLARGAKDAELAFRERGLEGLKSTIPALETAMEVVLTSAQVLKNFPG